MIQQNITPKSILKKNVTFNNNNKTKKQINIDTSKNIPYSYSYSYKPPIYKTPKPITTTIPNTLTIYIKTQVPGAQIIKYNPSMTFPNIQSKVVQFDPLVKLSQSIIDSVPKEYQVFEFFDKNFFKSLILKSPPPLTSIKEATDQGFVDNNITITLNNIFKKNSIFYINKNPYVIMGYEWERGNWKIDTKISEIPTTYKGQYGINSIPYRRMFLEQLKVAKAELNTLPKDVLTGPEFTPPNLISSSPVTPKPNPKQVIQPPTTVIQPPTTVIPPPTSEIKEIQPIKQKEEPSTTIVKRNPNIPTPPVTAIDVRKPTVPVPPVTTIEARKPTVPVPPVTTIEVRKPTIPVPPVTTIEVQKPKPREIINIPVPPETNYNIENVKTNEARKYSHEIHTFFSQPRYKDIVIDIYKNMNPDEKTIIVSNARTYSNTKSADMRNNYNRTVNALHVRPNTGGGDCLYISIAEAINEHNDNASESKKITYLSTTGVVYGITEPFTQIVIRTAVANYILNDPALVNEYLLLARGFADEMNKEVDTRYENANKTDLSVTESTYNSIVDHVYAIRDNFFIVKNPGGNPPFKVTDTTQEQIDYILSNSWADERILLLMPKILNLSVIPIAKNKETSNLSIPLFAMEESNNTKNIFYMFVYYSGNHYEEIYFSNSALNSVSIFDKTELTFLPPSYILLLLYGSYYYPLSPQKQQQVTFLNTILKAIDNSFNKIQDDNVNSLTYQNILVIKKFEAIFPSEKAHLSLIKAENTYKNKQNVPSKTVTGGAMDKHYTSHIENKTNISYYITITLNVYPGDTPSFKESSKAACSHNYSNLQKAWAELLGTKYNIQPNYNLLPNNYSRKILKQTATPRNNTTRKR